MDMLTCEFAMTAGANREVRPKIANFFKSLEEEPIMTLLAAQRTADSLRTDKMGLLWGMFIGIAIAKASADPEFQIASARKYSEYRAKGKEL